MLGHKQEKLLYRILSGKTIIYIDETRLDVHAPSLDLLYEACEIYDKFIEESGVLSKEDLKPVLLKKGVVTPEELKFLDEEANTLIENFQKELYINFRNVSAADAIRSYIAATRKDQERILTALSKYDTYTKEGLANYAKSIFLTQNTTYKKGKLYKFNKIKPITVLTKMAELSISPVTIRLISRSSQWTNLWFGYKGNNIFEGASSSIEQQLLMMWSRMYEGIKESPDCPDEDIIADDDALDGWLMLHKEKRLKERAEGKKDAEFNHHHSKLDRHQEVFFVAKSKEEADRIMERNNAQGKAIIQSRMKQIKDRGIVNHQDLLDVRQDVAMQFNKQEITNGRGN